MKQTQNWTIVIALFLIRGGRQNGYWQAQTNGRGFAGARGSRFFNWRRHRPNTPGRKPKATICFFTNLSNTAAFGGNVSPGCDHEKDRLFGSHTKKQNKKPCSEQFVSIFGIKKKKTHLNRTLGQSPIEQPSRRDAHVCFAISCSHLIKQRLLCNLWVLPFPWQPHVPRPWCFPSTAQIFSEGHSGA